MQNIFEPSRTQYLPIHQKIIEKLDYFIVSNKIPHIIFHGSSGSGKRKIVDDFLNKIYQYDKSKLKSNVMFVNCAHGKGIKFIREELKFFAKTNIQSNNGAIFKTIVLLNADFLTIDAQSALRRCIELFSYNTRFFIIVENKNKLLNPILSRFCEIYVPEYIENGKLVNLHQYSIHRNFDIDSPQDKSGYIHEKMEDLYSYETVDHSMLTELSNEFYENGVSCLDLIYWIRNTDKINNLEKATISICFDKIKSEYRCEKLLFLYILDFIFLRSNKDVKCILEI
uniref:Replication factor C C-terminal domain-containing protein n=1 Tax=viral metagenome TaxID=1070528 RepID=A0A6C0JR56_9ZZZZ